MMSSQSPKCFMKKCPKCKSIVPAVERCRICGTNLSYEKVLPDISSEKHAFTPYLLFYYIKCVGHQLANHIFPIVLPLILLLQLWAVYRRTESWLVFGISVVLMALGSSFLSERCGWKRGNFMKLLFSMSWVLMFAQLASNPYNLRTDQITILYPSYGEKGLSGVILEDPEQIAVVTDSLKGMCFEVPFYAVMPSYYSSDISVKINGKTLWLPGYYYEEFKHHGSFLCFTRNSGGKAGIFTRRWISAGKAQTFSQFLYSLEPDVSYTSRELMDGNCEALNEMIDVLDLDDEDIPWHLWVTKWR